MFSMARGSAASLEAVENAIRNGSRTARKNGPIGIRARAITAPNTTTTKRTEMAYMVRISLPSPNKHGDAFGADRDRQRRAHSQRRQVHDVAGVAKHHLRQRPAKLHHRTGLGADRRAGRSKQEGEHHHLEHIVTRHGVDNAGGEGMLQHGVEGALPGGGRGQGFGGGALDGHANSRPHQVDGAQAEKQGDGGDHFEVQQRLGADAAHVFELAGGHARHQDAEYQRRHDGADQAQKNVAEGRKLARHGRGPRFPRLRRLPWP